MRKKAIFLIFLICFTSLIIIQNSSNVIYNIKAAAHDTNTNINENNVTAISNVTIYLNETTNELINITVQWDNGTTQAFTPQNLSLLMNTSILVDVLNEQNQSQDQSQDQSQSTTVNIDFSTVNNDDFKDRAICFFTVSLIIVSISVFVYLIITVIKLNNNSGNYRKRRYS